jgi:hypothetical protein
MSKPAAFAAIATTDLAAVTGGRSTRSGRSTDTNERLLDKLESIQTAIKDVASQQTQNKGNDAMSQMMPIIAMSMLKRRR